MVPDGELVILAAIQASGFGVLTLIQMIFQAAHRTRPSTTPLAWPRRERWAEHKVGALRCGARVVSTLGPVQVARQVARMAAALALPAAELTAAVVEAAASAVVFGPCAGRSPGGAPTRRKRRPGARAGVTGRPYCDRATRQVELPDGTVARCPRCHELALEHQRVRLVTCPTCGHAAPARLSGGRP